MLSVGAVNQATGTGSAEMSNAPPGAIKSPPPKVTPRSAFAKTNGKFRP